MSDIVSKSVPDSMRCRVFYETASAGSVGAAARALGLTQSTVSYHIQKLEEEIGVDLFDRRSRPAKLTAEGRELAKNLEFIYRHLEDTLNTLKSRSGQLLELRLGLVESLSITLGPALVSHFYASAHKISVITSSSMNLLDYLASGKIDFAIANSPNVDRTKFVTLPLYYEPSVLAMPKGVSGTRKRWTWEQLRFCGLPFVSSSFDTSNNAITRSFFNSIYISLPVKVEVNESGLRLALISKGLGWSLIRPVITFKFPELMENIDILPMPEPILERTIYLAIRRNEQMESAKAIAAFARAFLAEEVRKKTLERAPWLEEYFRTHTIAR